MRTISSLSEERQKNNAIETVKMLIPLAREIGAKDIEQELTRICSQILTKEEFGQAVGESLKFEKEITEKGYHKDRIEECCVDTVL